MGYDSSSFDAPMVLFITYCDCDVVRSLNEDFILKSIGCFQTKRNDVRGIQEVCSSDKKQFSFLQELTEMLCAIWHSLYSLKKLKNVNGGVLLLVKLQALACKFTTSVSVFHFLKLRKWYHIVQNVRNYSLTRKNVNHC